MGTNKRKVSTLFFVIDKIVGTLFWVVTTTTHNTCRKYFLIINIENFIQDTVYDCLNGILPLSTRLSQSSKVARFKIRNECNRIDGVTVEAMGCHIDNKRCCAHAKWWGIWKARVWKQLFSLQLIYMMKTMSLMTYKRCM